MPTVGSCSIRPIGLTAHWKNGRSANNRARFTFLVGAVSSQRSIQLRSIFASGSVPTSLLTLSRMKRRITFVLGLYSLNVVELSQRSIASLTEPEPPRAATAATASPGFWPRSAA